MSIDKSLKTGGSLTKHRNVLTRAERISKLDDEGRWEEGQNPFGLLKVAHRKAKVGAKAKKKKDEGAEDTPAEGAAGAKQ